MRLSLGCVAAVALTVVGSGGTGVALPSHTASSSPGLPGGWQAKAVRAAKASLATCAKSTSLSPDGCPQNISSPFAAGPAISVHWALLSHPLAKAVAVAATSQTSGPSDEADVYGRFQMTVSYTTSGQSTRPYQAYVGGLIEARMTWDGRSFQDVTFGAPGAPLLPRKVRVAPFRRPRGATDAAALASVTNGFHDCATLPPPPTDPTIPGCPQTDTTDDQATSAQWSFTNDPVQGAIVSFDAEHGNVAVTGNFVATLNYVVNGNPGYLNNGPHTQTTNGKYTATLVWNRNQLELLDIAES